MRRASLGSLGILVLAGFCAVVGNASARTDPLDPKVHAGADDQDQAMLCEDTSASEPAMQSVGPIQGTSCKCTNKCPFTPNREGTYYNGKFVHCGCWH
jgi:hypothetical protein